ncbi:MAG: hypothetical protein NC398_06345 [Acetatifactor muris]|nr:hypothetical protein [Acetatifactor muris]
MRASSSAFSNVPGDMKAAEQEMSLLDILRNALAGGRKLWGRIWGVETGGDAAVGAQNSTAGDREGLAGTNPVVTLNEDALHDKDHAAKMAAGTAAVQTHMTNVSENPYFTTSSDSGATKERMYDRMRVRFRDLTDRMSRRFGGRAGARTAERSLGRNTSRFGRDRQREDLRKRSRYKGVDSEIDCILTDDSYLLDSYDRNGEYTQLTTQDKRQMADGAQTATGRNMETSPGGES